MNNNGIFPKRRAYRYLEHVMDFEAPSARLARRKLALTSLYLARTAIASERRMSIQTPPGSGKRY